MKPIFSALIVLGLLFPLAHSVKSEELLNLPEGKAMLPDQAISYARQMGKIGVLEKIPVEGQSFKEAIRVTVNERGNNPWDLQFEISSRIKVSKEDAVIVRMWMRTVSAENETGEAYVSGGLQRGKAPNEKPVWISCSVPRQWQLIEFGGICNVDLPEDQAKFYMHLGQYRQTVEIAEIQMTNYGPGVPRRLLPHPKLTYDGRKPDAPWRKEAESNIDKIRKGNLSIKVVDQEGHPVEGAKVLIKMKKHAFPFGTCVNANYLSGSIDASKPDVKKYREEFLKLFNCAVIENHLKPPSWENPKSRECAMNALKWLKEHDIATRGHTAVWPSERYFPREWKTLIGYKDGDPARSGDKLLSSISETNKTKLYNAVRNHVSEIFAATKGYCFQWDVINEPYSNHTLMDLFGDQVMVEWFKAAKLANPSTRLFINDYGIVMDEKHAAHYLKTIKFLQDNGAPLEGIGEQGHYGQQPPSLSKVIKTYDTLGSFGLPVVCTEFDVDSQDEDLQADYLRDYMTALFGHPACGGFLLWGFWEGSHWKPEAAMLSRDWTQKPSYKAYYELVFKTWWTDVSGATDPSGSFTTRGFLGDYEVSTTGKGITKTENVRLEKDGTEVVVKI